MVERRGECESGEFRGESTIMTVRKGHRKLKEEKSQIGDAHTPDRKGGVMKSKQREEKQTDKTKSLNDSSFCSSTLDF